MAEYNWRKFTSKNYILCVFPDDSDYLFSMVRRHNPKYKKPMMSHRGYVPDYDYLECGLSLVFDDSMDNRLPFALFSGWRYDL